MPDLKLANQPFDLAFHPTEPFVYTCLLTGEIKAFKYDDDTGDTHKGWTVRPTKKCCRGLVVQEDGRRLWAVGKAGGLHGIDSMTGKVTDDRQEAHGSPINRITNLFANMIATGDDEGVVKLWDHRQQNQIREYRHHWEYISDFEFLDDKKQLVSTSGDATLSVTDIRSNKSEPLSVSEDQDDELLSIVQIKGGSKSVVGSQLGILSVWDRTKGWGDCVDRIPGHPASIETLVALTPDIIATGSEDGMIRVMQLYPTKFLGVIASHEEFPIERIKLDRNGKWLGSVSHDETLKMTDVADLFEDSDGEDEDEDEDMGDEPVRASSPEKGKGKAGSGGEDEDGDTVMTEASEDEGEEGAGGEGEEEEDSDEEEERRREKAKKDKKKDQKGMKKILANSGKMKQEDAAAPQGFFDDL